MNKKIKIEQLAIEFPENFKDDASLSAKINHITQNEIIPHIIKKIEVNDLEYLKLDQLKINIDLGKIKNSYDHLTEEEFDFFLREHMISHINFNFHFIEDQIVSKKHDLLLHFSEIITKFCKTSTLESNLLDQSEINLDELLDKLIKHSYSHLNSVIELLLENDNALRRFFLAFSKKNRYNMGIYIKNNYLKNFHINRYQQFTKLNIQNFQLTGKSHYISKIEHIVEILTTNKNSLSFYEINNPHKQSNFHKKFPEHLNTIDKNFRLSNISIQGTNNNNTLVSEFFEILENRNYKLLAMLFSRIDNHNIIIFEKIFRLLDPNVKNSILEQIKFAKDDSFYISLKSSSNSLTDPQKSIAGEKITLNLDKYENFNESINKTITTFFEILEIGDYSLVKLFLTNIISQQNYDTIFRIIDFINPKHKLLPDIKKFLKELEPNNIIKNKIIESQTSLKYNNENLYPASKFTENEINSAPIYNDDPLIEAVNLSIKMSNTPINQSLFFNENTNIFFAISELISIIENSDSNRDIVGIVQKFNQEDFIKIVEFIYNIATNYLNILAKKSYQTEYNNPNRNTFTDAYTMPLNYEHKSFYYAIESILKRNSFDIEKSIKSILELKKISQNLRNNENTYIKVLGAPTENEETFQKAIKELDFPNKSINIENSKINNLASIYKDDHLKIFVNYFLQQMPTYLREKDELKIFIKNLKFFCSDNYDVLSEKIFDKFVDDLVYFISNKKEYNIKIENSDNKFLKILSTLEYYRLELSNYVNKLNQYFLKSSQNNTDFDCKKFKIYIKNIKKNLDTAVKKLYDSYSKLYNIAERANNYENNLKSPKKADILDTYPLVQAKLIEFLHSNIFNESIIINKLDKNLRASLNALILNIIQHQKQYNYTDFNMFFKIIDSKNHEKTIKYIGFLKKEIEAFHNNFVLEGNYDKTNFTKAKNYFFKKIYNILDKATQHISNYHEEDFLVKTSKSDLIKNTLIIKTNLANYPKVNNEAWYFIKEKVLFDIGINFTKLSAVDIIIKFLEIENQASEKSFYRDFTNLVSQLLLHESNHVMEFSKIVLSKIIEEKNRTLSNYTIINISQTKFTIVLSNIQKKLRKIINIIEKNNEKFYSKISQKIQNNFYSTDEIIGHVTDHTDTNDHSYFEKLLQNYESNITGGDIYKMRRDFLQLIRMDDFIKFITTEIHINRFFKIISSTQLLSIDFIKFIDSVSKSFNIPNYEIWQQVLIFYKNNSQLNKIKFEKNLYKFLVKNFNIHKNFAKALEYSRNLSLINISSNLSKVEEILAKYAYADKNYLIANAKKIIDQIRPFFYYDSDFIAIYSKNSNVLQEIIDSLIPKIANDRMSENEKKNFYLSALRALVKYNFNENNFEKILNREINKSDIFPELLNHSLGEEVEEDTKRYATNGGLIFLWPFIPNLLCNLGFMDKNYKFKDFTSLNNAIHILNFVVTGKLSMSEWNLAVPKILCGLEITDTIYNSYQPNIGELPKWLEENSNTWTSYVEKNTIDHIEMETYKEIRKIMEAIDNWIIGSFKKWDKLNRLMQLEEFLGDYNFIKIRRYLFDRMFNLTWNSKKDYYHLEIPFQIYDLEGLLPEWFSEDCKFPWMKKRLVYYWL